MSSASQAVRLATQRPGRFPHTSIGTLLWITLVWVLLWGEMTPGNVLGGVLVAFVVTSAVPFPAARFDARFRPWALVRLGVIFAWDLVVASLKLSWFVLSGRRPRSAIIRVALASESDAYLAMIAGMSALVPGTVVVDAHGPSGTLYVHVFDVGLSGGVSAAHNSILQLEERILRAFASRAQLIAAGYVPGSTPSSGRLPRPFAPAAPGGAELPGSAGPGSSGAAPDSAAPASSMAPASPVAPASSVAGGSGASKAPLPPGDSSSAPASKDPASAPDSAAPASSMAPASKAQASKALDSAERRPEGGEES
ncbi:MAG: Na+/H+ antiporter subunit E [Actinomycetaceae bacterium]|nr:Na+/H+ antiporter subunit E [Actinomycetaceae bacterium]